MTPMQDWASFWDSPHSIYVNARHFDVHYRDIAAGVAALLPRPGLRVLDFGCGEALHAGIVAAQASKLYLCEIAPNVRASLKRRFAAEPKIRVVTPDDVAAMADGALDFIVANSVVQYLSPQELGRKLAEWRRLLAPGGILVIGDVNPPHSNPVTEIAALMRYALRNRFFIAALGGLARTLFSDYRRLRSKLGLTRYSEAEFLDTLRRGGFTGERLAKNLEHNPARMTFRAVVSP